MTPSRRDLFNINVRQLKDLSRFSHWRVGVTKTQLSIRVDTPTPDLASGSQ
uniref:Uncharacterized protein n=1 Tax=Arion vulgaris TaxID=1028688 RepID=A0A0B7AQ63_9EUPU